jgi:hypothetical protein
MWIYETSIRLVVLAWVFTGLMLVLLVACVAASRGALRLNHFFGVRLPSLMRSNAAWRAGHAAAVLPSAVSFAVALVASAVGLAIPVGYWVAIIAFVGDVIWVFIRASAGAKASLPS